MEAVWGPVFKGASVVGTEKEPVVDSDSGDAARDLAELCRNSHEGADGRCTNRRKNLRESLPAGFKRCGYLAQTRLLWRNVLVVTSV